MAEYDFRGLSPFEFEALCHDILEAKLSVPLQAFVTGRDKGTDLRHAPTSSNRWIVQCKHFAKSGFAKLRSHLKRIELPKIAKLNPERYVLATSIGLSPANVDDLFQLLSPYCRSPHDIIGCNDLNAVLRSNPKIERAHFKLWLTSEAVLSRLLNNDTFVQSWLTEEEIRQRLSLYVYTDTFNRARQKLADERVCILSGVPGVGKTTLSEMLLVDGLTAGWELVTIQQNVSEALRAFRADPTARQIFYYDDFLGQIAKGDKLAKNEDRSLLQLIAGITRTATKRFILTTREYILAQAKAEHEYLARSNIDLYRLVVTCEDYSEVEKAQILANHLYFAGVSQKHIAALVEDRLYRRIISHRNYSPRLIEWMTNRKETQACRAAQYPNLFLARLDNPSELWTHAFENQLSSGSRHLLLVLASCGDEVYLSDLQEAFDSFYVQRARQHGFATTPECFMKAINELEGTFIRIERSSAETVILFHNPSVLDFLRQRLLTNRRDMTELLTCSCFFEQVVRLVHVFKSQDRADDDDSNVDAAILIDAIGRTFLKRSIRLHHSDRPISRWNRSHRSTSERLRTCCWVGSTCADPSLRAAIEGRIHSHLSEIDSPAGQITGVTTLLDAAERCRWIDPDVIRKWTESFWHSLLALEDEFDETLEGLVATAKWFSDNRPKFADSDSNSFVDNISSAVTRELENESQTNDPAVLGGNLASLEEIGKSLGKTFSEDVKWLNEALAECGPADSGDDGGNWRDHRPDACSSSIEGMFDSLLE